MSHVGKRTDVFLSFDGVLYKAYRLGAQGCVTIAGLGDEPFEMSGKAMTIEARFIPEYEGWNKIKGVVVNTALPPTTNLTPEGEPPIDHDPQQETVIRLTIQEDKKASVVPKPTPAAG